MNGTTDNNSQVNELNALMGGNLFLYDSEDRSLPTIAARMIGAEGEIDLEVPVIISAGSTKVYAPKKGEKTSDVIKKAKKDGARKKKKKSALDEMEKGVDVREVGLETDKDHEEIEM